MGGEGTSFRSSSPEDEESSLDQDFEKLPSEIGDYVWDAFSMKIEDFEVNEGNELELEEFDDFGRRGSSVSFYSDINRRRRRRIYGDILQSYNNLKIESRNLEEVKSKILSYTPGAWIEEVGGMKANQYDVPKTTTLILIGPRESGKSSLVNRISRVFEDDIFASERAQISYNSSVGHGTFFLQEYMIPRGSNNFCLYDTRSLSDDPSDSFKMLKRWMTKGVRHGEVVIRDSDSPSIRTTIKCKTRRTAHYYSEKRMVNFVIFVVNGLSVLKSMDGKNDMNYTSILAKTFSCPYLSFKDDKPVVVVTHGDLLSYSDRACIRFHLGELLGISPINQIFDISENCDPATEREIMGMLRYSLEHADRNFPCKDSAVHKVSTGSLLAGILLVTFLVIIISSAYRYHTPPTIDWSATSSTYKYCTAPTIDSHATSSAYKNCTPPTIDQHATSSAHKYRIPTTIDQHATNSAYKGPKAPTIDQHATSSTYKDRTPTTIDQHATSSAYKDRTPTTIDQLATSSAYKGPKPPTIDQHATSSAYKHRTPPTIDQHATSSAYKDRTPPTIDQHATSSAYKDRTPPTIDQHATSSACKDCTPTTIDWHAIRHIW